MSGTTRHVRTRQEDCSHMSELVLLTRLSGLTQPRHYPFYNCKSARGLDLAEPQHDGQEISETGVRGFCGTLGEIREIDHDYVPFNCRPPFVAVGHIVGKTMARVILPALPARSVPRRVHIYPAELCTTVSLLVIFRPTLFSNSAVYRITGLSRGNRIKQRRAWLLLGWMTAERSCPCKQLACPAVDSGSEVTFKSLISKLSVREVFLALTAW
ncbi:hypothetical protein J6590_049311 [Homalodisca vitripennis]|nr:hypothetical protein J6590_049311 [Homalodisca vitripennis]